MVGRSSKRAAAGIPSKVDTPGAEERGAKPEFLERGQYLELLVSRRQLLRKDDMSRGVRGLYDPTAATWYLIEEAILFSLD